jgi:LacI family transcriptional regulator
MRPPALKDIAAVAGVSVMTASNVLRATSKDGRKLFSDETEKKVINAARRLGYVPNRAARSMRTRQTGVIGFVSANFSKEEGLVDNYPVHPFLVGMNHVLAPTGRHVALVELDELELKKGILPTALQERFFDALVIHFGLAPQTLRVLETSRIPIIYWDSGIFQKENCIYRDEFAVGRAVTERLAALGHERIGFHVGSGANWDRYQKGEFVHYSFPQRYEGYSSALRERGLRITRLKGYEHGELFRQIEKNRITAVIASSTLPFVRAMAAHGKKIPEDLSILSCDVESSVLNREQIGGALYNRYEAGRIAAQMIIGRLESGRRGVPSVTLPMDVSDGSMAGAVR